MNSANSSEDEMPEFYPIAAYLKGEFEVEKKGDSKKLKLRKLCWETMFGQELMKLTVMDLVMKIVQKLIFKWIK